MLVRKLQSLPNATILTNAQTTEITGNGEKVNGLRYKNRTNGVEHDVALEGVFVQIGLVPNTEWLDGVVERNRFGEVIGRRARPHQRVGRVRGGGFDHRAVQADHHRHGRGRQGRTVRLRSPDPGAAGRSRLRLSDPRASSRAARKRARFFLCPPPGNRVAGRVTKKIS
ncbi:putative alkyl hydroperoxide reductase subunit f (partial sequence c terminus) protein [Ralstonia solanacearum IPO1609]|uniref:Alkyl hydroperoxide reductase subunit f (Partial sequence c terminus) protein n=1 Tax=Ralstonia solanacearum IPO1609 TaxID=564066 RepID=A0A7U7PQR5_RALSL|nr:putative alkyl hydroperoxide reductase subunit f (partial sequence c terminus) protein [Ralstonia solanacearum IPO1609]